MNVFWPEGLQKLAESGEITFKDGERLNLNVVRKMDNGLYLINLKGKSFTANLESEPQGKTVRAEVMRSDSGGLQLKIIPKAENSSNPMRVVTRTVQPQQQAAQSQAKQAVQTTQSEQTAKGAQSAMPEQSEQTAPQTAKAAQAAGQQIQSPKQQLVFQLPEGTIDVKQGERVSIQILKSLDNGNTLVSVKNNLFEVKLDSHLLKKITAEVFKADGLIELVADKLPVENLNTAFVKQEVGGFDLEKLMKAFGKFQRVDVENITPESLKQAVKNSGLFMENKLLHDENMSGDEKMRAYISSDHPAKDGITRMQVTNMLLAGGMLAFLKTADEKIDDTYMRLKKGDKGQSVLYLSTKFSKLGDTFIAIRSLNDVHDVMIKTEEDISDMLKDVNIERARIHWYKFNKKDLETINVKDEAVLNMGNFEVII